MKEGLIEKCITMFQDIIRIYNDTINGIPGAITEDPLKTYQVLKYLMDLLIPVSVTIMTVLFMLDFMKRTINFELVTFESVLKLFMKLFLSTYIMSNPDKVLGMLTGTSEFVISLINVNGSSSLISESIIDNLREGLAKENTGAIFATLNRLTISSYLVPILASVAYLIAWLRMVEISILASISPLAFATMVNEDTSDVFKNFLKQFGSVCVQGAVLVISIVIFRLINTTNTPLSIKYYTTPELIIVQSVISLIVLCSVMYKSSSISRKLIGLA